MSEVQLGESFPCCTAALVCVLLWMWWTWYEGQEWWENLFRPPSP